MCDGSIVRSGHDRGFGDFLVLCAGGFDFCYCHLSERTVKGGSVKAGREVGEVGSDVPPAGDRESPSAVLAGRGAARTDWMRDPAPRRVAGGSYPSFLLPAVPVRSVTGCVSAPSAGRR